MNYFKHSTTRSTLVFVLLLFIFAPFTLIVYPWFDYMDGCEHAAAVKELCRSLRSPQNPHLDLPGDTSTRFVPSIIIMALIKKIFHLGLFSVLGVSSIVSFILLGTGIYLFTKEYFNDLDQPLYAFLCILFLWGKGWGGTNSYMFSALVFNAYYPSVIAFIGIFFALFSLLRYCKRKETIYFIAFIILGCLIFLNHPFTGFLLFFFAFMLIVTEPYAQKKTLLILFIIATFVAIGLTTLWPYYSFFRSMLFLATGKAQQFWDYRVGQNYHYSDLATRIGPGFLGIIPLIYFAAKKKYPFIVLGFLLCLILYAINYLFKIYILERLIYPCMLFLQLGFARFLKELIDNKIEFKGALSYPVVKIIFLSALVIGAGIQLFMVGQTYLPQFFEWEPRLRVKPYENPMQRYITLKGYLPEGSVVLSDICTSWILPCVTDAKVVALFHNSLVFPQNMERMDDTERFFISPEERNKIIQKYHISHVLVDRTKFPVDKTSDYKVFIPYPDEPLFKSLSALGKVLVNNKDFFLVTVNRPAQKAYQQKFTHLFSALRFSPGA